MGVMIASLAQSLCDVAMALFVFVDSELEHKKQEISGHSVVASAIVVLGLVHLLLSLSIFTKATILMCSTRS